MACKAHLFLFILQRFACYSAVVEVGEYSIQVVYSAAKSLFMASWRVWAERATETQPTLVGLCLWAVTTLAALSRTQAIILPFNPPLLHSPIQFLSETVGRVTAWKAFRQQDNWVTHLPVVADVVAGDGDVSLSCQSRPALRSWVVTATLSAMASFHSLSCDRLFKHLLLSLFLLCFNESGDCRLRRRDGMRVAFN